LGLWAGFEPVLCPYYRLDLTGNCRNEKRPPLEPFLWLGVHGVFHAYRRPLAVARGVAYPWEFGLAAVTAVVTIARPEWLAPLNRLWMKFGELMHRVVSPVVLGVIFYGVFTPIGLVMRMAGRDSMKRKFKAAAPTYWIERDPPGPPAESFRDQF